MPMSKQQGRIVSNMVSVWWLSCITLQCLSISAMALHSYGPSYYFSTTGSSLSSSSSESSFFGNSNTITNNHMRLQCGDDRDGSCGVNSHRNFLIMMGKGDGKKKRPKTSTTASSSTPAATPTPAQPAPMRVSNDINIPIKRQIRYGKLNKQLRQNAGQSFRQTKKVVRTKYRRTWDEEEIELKAEERKRKGQNPDWDVILNRTAAAPLVIVDGYNIIHKWARLKKHMNKGDPQRARQLLLDDLENLRSIKGWRIEVVYDGAGRNSQNGVLGYTRQSLMAVDKAANKDVSKFGVRQVFTGTGVEADSYIEERCANAKNVTGGEYTGSFIVATDDAMIRLAGQNAGALCMGADRFVDELKAVKKAVAYRVEAAMAKVNGEAMRPEKLWGTNTFSSRGAGSSSPSNSPATIPTKESKKNSRNKEEELLNKLQSKSSSKSSSSSNSLGAGEVKKTADGKTVYTGRFGRGAFVIEDRRKKKKLKKNK